MDIVYIKDIKAGTKYLPKTTRNWYRAGKVQWIKYKRTKGYIVQILEEGYKELVKEISTELSKSGNLNIYGEDKPS